MIDKILQHDIHTQVTGQPRMTVVHDPELVRHVLTNVNIYGKGPIWRNK